MKIRLASVFISDLDKAQAFYTDVLGFVISQDVPMGDTRYVTLVSPEDPDGAELLLEPNGEHPPTKTYKQALFDEGIPLTAFEVNDIHAEYTRLKDLGVTFRSQPERCGHEITAVFDDTCGNLIMLYEVDDKQ